MDGYIRSKLSTGLNDLKSTADLQGINQRYFSTYHAIAEEEEYMMMQSCMCFIFHNTQMDVEKNNFHKKCVIYHKNFFFKSVF